MGTRFKGVAQTWFGVVALPLISVWSVALAAAAAAPSAAKTLQAFLERRLRRRTYEIIAAAVARPTVGGQASLSSLRIDDDGEA